MIVAARETLLTAEGGTPIPFFTQRFLAPRFRIGPYAHAAWGLASGLCKYETAGGLHRFCRNRRSRCLRRGPDRRSLVAGNKSAGIPQLVFFHAVGRVAACREGIVSSMFHTSRAC